MDIQVGKNTGVAIYKNSNELNIMSVVCYIVQSLHVFTSTYSI